MSSIALSHPADTDFSHAALSALLRPHGSPLPPLQALRRLQERGLDQLPLPGHGATLRRWQMLATIAAIDLSLLKLYESHTDALAILAELGGPGAPAGSSWGVWSADMPDARVRLRQMAAMCSTDARPGVQAHMASAMP